MEYLTIQEVEFKRVSNGEFEIYNKRIKTNLRIINGSRGCSGRNTTNMYGICIPELDKVVWCGSLQRAKKTVKHILRKID